MSCACRAVLQPRGAGLGQAAGPDGVLGGGGGGAPHPTPPAPAPSAACPSPAWCAALETVSHTQLCGGECHPLAG